MRRGGSMPSACGGGSSHAVHVFVLSERRARINFRTHCQGHPWNLPSIALFAHLRLSGRAFRH